MKAPDMRLTKCDQPGVVGCGCPWQQSCTPRCTRNWLWCVWQKDTRLIFLLHAPPLPAPPGLPAPGHRTNTGCNISILPNNLISSLLLAPEGWEGKPLPELGSTRTNRSQYTATANQREWLWNLQNFLWSVQVSRTWIYNNHCAHGLSSPQPNKTSI